MKVGSRLEAEVAQRVRIGQVHSVKRTIVPIQSFTNGIRRLGESLIVRYTRAVDATFMTLT
jgi:hypothetical protein